MKRLNPTFAADPSVFQAISEAYVPVVNVKKSKATTHENNQAKIGLSTNEKKGVMLALRP